MHAFLGVACGLRKAVAGVVVLLALAAAGEARAQIAPSLGSQGQTAQAQNNTVTCSGALPFQSLRKGAKSGLNQQPNLVISKACTVSRPGNYYYGTVNIISGGSLTFSEPSGKGSRVDFWANNIIVENGGAFSAGTASAPYGARGGVLNIFIYGKNQSGTSDPYTTPGQGALCATPQSNTVGPCGIPLAIWNDNGANVQSLPGGVSDYFYQYGPNYGDYLCTDGTKWSNGTCGTSSGQVGYFGYKVFAVSYGGKLSLFGYKGTPLVKPKPKAFRPFIPLGPGSQGTGSQGAAGGNSLANLLDPGASAQSQDGDSTDSAAASERAAATPAPTPAQVDADPTNTGNSWMRLAGNLAMLSAAKKSAPNTLTLSKSPGDHWWSSNDNKTVPDQVVVTTTDYLPGHSEKLTISSLTGTTLSFLDAIQYPHNGTRYQVGTRLGTSLSRFQNIDKDLLNNGAETRAAVALLTRSIRILSAGDMPGQTWEQSSKVSTNCQNGAVVPYCYYFGANMVVRQAIQLFEIQGVEFVNMGQGGKLGHYPLHFHMARQVPANTFVKDSSVNESMTRCFVLHATLGVLLQRNVCWKSIGHMFFLESGTETDNKLYSNLGIFARAAISNPQNPRNVPGIFSAGPNFTNSNPINTASPNAFPFASDIQQPTVFWISNGWNDFVGNMAAGAGACGAAYWFIPAQNNDMPDVMTGSNTWFSGEMKWPGSSGSTTTTSYAGLQNNMNNAGTTPLRLFSGNYATSAMNSFQTVVNVTPCYGINYPGTAADGNFPVPIQGVQGFAPAPVQPTTGASNQPANGTSYYPYMSTGGRIATLCSTTNGLDCSAITGTPPSGAGGSPCSNPPNEGSCAVTVLDRFTSSFHWAEQNFSAMWLRPQWYMVSNSVLTDVQTAGITFISGGDYTRSSSIQGGWKLIIDSVFAGYTQSPSNGYAPNGYVSSASPFMNGLPGSLTCDNVLNGGIPPAQACINAAEGVSFPLSNFGAGQRMFSIYDGPASQDSNIYLDINTTACGNDAGTNPPCLYSNTVGVRQGMVNGVATCYLPNAAIGWKQPNGFFYPPVFHSTNLFFGNVDIRHYVIDALFLYGTYNEDTTTAMADYCTNGAGYSSAMFNNFTDIDRQTELTDDDGSLTGLINNWTPTTTGTVSVNPATFFTAPVQTNQCLSDVGVTPSLACPPPSPPPAPPTPTTAITSPYEYVTMAVYPQCGVSGTTDPSCSSFSTTYWGNSCSLPNCYGIPLYRQYLTGTGGEMLDWTTDGCGTPSGQTATACRWPFVRMGGESSDQRSTMTANNGVYYLDTAVGLTQQTSEPFSTMGSADPNVFQPGQTYYVYFIYAKPDTQQTIQLYVGSGFSTSTGLQGVRIIPNGWPLQTSWVTLMGAGTLPAGWTSSYDASTGILSVTTNFSQLTDIPPSPPTQANGLCMPSSFCAITNGSCGCAAYKSTDPLYPQCQEACSVWAVKDLDYPVAGAYGFAFTLPSGFTTATYNASALGPPYRPQPTTFPATSTNSNGPDWLAQFLNTSVAPDNASGGQCYYTSTSLPGSPSCPVISPNPTSN